MRRNLLFFTLGAVAALAMVIEQRFREQNARQWARLRARRRAQGGPGTAFITGASSGIGVAFARELAHRGYHLVLLARREARLRELAEALGREYSVQVETITADLANPSDLERAAVRAGEIPDLDLLVNNAGFGDTSLFLKSDPQESLRMIRVHVEASVRLARAALPGMVERGFGGVINVSSVLGLVPVVSGHTYGATKAYLNFFTETLSYELAGTGVRVQALCPGLTCTEFHGDSRPKLPAFMWLRAQDVVEESLKGLREGRPLVITGRMYRLLVLAAANPLIRPLIRFAQSQGLGKLVLARLV
jgi:short-subunit dehydrogenase